MIKYGMLLFLILGLTACTVKDEAFYRAHPDQLKDAVQSCPNKTPERLSCQQVEAIWQVMTHLAYDLQASPQRFGGKILALQETLVKQKADWAKGDNSADLKDKIAKNESDLVNYLAVARWLESPEG